MYDNKGVTLVATAITIIILLIIVGVTYSVGTDSYQVATMTGYVARMNMVQQQVNIASIRKANGDTSVDMYGTTIPNNKIQNAKNAIGNNDDLSNYRYFTKADLKRYLGLDGIDETVIVNFNTRVIYSIDAIKYKGKMYYNQYDLPDGQYNVGYATTEVTGDGPTFEIQKLNHGLYTTLNVQNIQYSGNVDGGKIEYGYVEALNQNGDTTEIEVDYWRQIANNTVDVNKSGVYAIKVADKAGRESTEIVDVAIVNAPVIKDGMIPIKYDESTNNWVQVSENDGTWYDYSNGKWANMMLSDGTDNGNTIDAGAMFVWIPRYAYNIKSGYHTSNVGQIDVKFLKNDTNLTTDETSIRIENISGSDTWNVPPAFIDDSANGYTNGGWDEEITGMWVAKYNGNDNISESDIFVGCLNMNAEGNTYGLTKDSYPHQMKTSEWGAVVYLAHSKYGLNGRAIQNNNSTTGNEFGIYGMDGQTWEYTAGGNFDVIDSDFKYNIEIQSALNIPDANSFPEKYFSRYSYTYGMGKDGITTVYGDAIYETSAQTTGSTSWNSKGSTYIDQDTPYFVVNGIFGFSGLDGLAHNQISFRPVII